MTDLSIIIISYNTKDITKKCLETVVESLNYNEKGHSGLSRVSENRDSGVLTKVPRPQNDREFKTEIIVLDNASTDGSVKMLESFEKSDPPAGGQNIKFEIIKSQENLGFAKGNNRAVKEATGEYLLFLNSDIEVIGDAIPHLYSFCSIEQKLFNFVGGKLLEKDGHTPQPSAGPFYSLPVIFGALFLKGDYWGLTRSSPNKTKAVDWVSGACIMCKKTDFEAVGGFDEAIFMYMDEVDLLYRAKKQNMTVGFFPDARFIHIGFASSGGKSQPILQVYKGFLFFYKKHFFLKLASLKSMLQLKARIALFIGRLTGNQYLIETYEKAIAIVKSS